MKTKVFNMRNISILLVILFILLSISCVSASDDADATVDNMNNVSNINTQVPGSFSDLSNDIGNMHANETYNLTRDYAFDDGHKYAYGTKVIKISQDNLVINGNGFTIDVGAEQHFAIFDVVGNNVTIKNIIFANSQPDGLKGPNIYGGNTKFSKISSPVSWQGNNGHMYNCTFKDNAAVNGGALNWMGNNGTIDECQFINNLQQALQVHCIWADQTIQYPTVCFTIPLHNYCNFKYCCCNL